MRPLFALLLLGVCGCKTIPLTNDPNAPARDRHVSPAALYEIDWWQPLVKLALLEYFPAETARPAALTAEEEYRPAPPIGVELATSEEDLYVGPTYPVLRDDEEENGSSTQTYFQRPGQTKPQSPRKR